MAERLEARGADIKTHWRHLTEVLRSKGFWIGSSALCPNLYAAFSSR